ncbi:hypothetical protein [Cytobacillus oceanisediminis]|uniref:Uncharacterized protein n=1 Tax=Cytobacillus oceanisediminis TaxID=665099 RepID=A0ABX3CYI9_9BACI|nr:hypothetical protein [Cytobacillus oceanisediminis]OHX50214.1 hypothetical protein BBV17_08890 [Cytobacillus oceanisediminis]
MDKFIRSNNQFIIFAIKTAYAEKADFSHLISRLTIQRQTYVHFHTRRHIFLLPFFTNIMFHEDKRRKALEEQS